MNHWAKRSKEMLIKLFIPGDPKPYAIATQLVQGDHYEDKGSTSYLVINKYGTRQERDSALTAAEPSQLRKG